MPAMSWFVDNLRNARVLHFMVTRRVSFAPTTSMASGADVELEDLSNLKARKAMKNEENEEATVDDAPTRYDMSVTYWAYASAVM